MASNSSSSSSGSRPSNREYGTTRQNHDHHPDLDMDIESHNTNRNDSTDSTQEDISEESTLLWSSPSSSMSSSEAPSSSMTWKMVLAVSALLSTVLVISTHGFPSGSGEASHLMYDATHLLGIEEKEIGSALDRYLPNSCPGLLLTSGVSDPRDLVINGAEIAGVGAHGFEEAQAAIFTTGQYNKHSVNWILATKAQGEGYSEFHMAMIEITSENNNVLACVLEAGLVEVSPEMKLDDSNVHQAWASRKNQDISICDTCPGLGVKNLVTTATDLGYNKQQSRYQVHF